MRTPTFSRLRPVIVLAALALAGCVAGLGEDAGRAAPPPSPMPEFPSPAPAPGMVWVTGAWHWDGNDYVWVPGHWVSPPPSP